MPYSFPVERTSSPKPKPDPKQLGFGKFFTDHLFVMDHSADKGWADARIVPYAPLSLDPASMILHYGQGVFEGLKAYHTADGGLLLFRPQKNNERMNASNLRMCMPTIEPELWLEAVKALIREDRDWVPKSEGTSLYIRPFIFATDPFLGVRPATLYKFMIILSPVGSYYPQGINPIRIYVENEYVRAVRGGVGFAKTIGNYAAGMRAQMDDQQKGYIQVLWLDGIERKYIEEVGAMNVFFKIGGEVITPALQGSILPGVTRDSVIHLLKDWGIPVSERRLAIQELYEANQAGRLEEAFGTGTAAVISPVGELCWANQKMEINGGKTGELSRRLYDTLTGIQNGMLEDKFGWTVEID